MRKKLLWLGVALSLVAGVAVAEIDLADFDVDLMKAMEETNKYLEPDINAKNAKNAYEGIEVIQQGLKWTEDYFVAKGTAPDGVKLAQDGQQHIVRIKQGLDAGNFDAAAAAARELTKNCRACHDLYKPRQ